jgi:hypothetical protein
VIYPGFAGGDRTDTRLPQNSAGHVRKIACNG